MFSSSKSMLKILFYGSSYYIYLLKNNHKNRILHVINSMNVGGIENWLMNLLRVINKDLFQMDFLVHITKKSVYDEEIIGLGSIILRCPWPQKP